VTFNSELTFQIMLPTTTINTLYTTSCWRFHITNWLQLQFFYTIHVHNALAIDECRNFVKIFCTKKFNGGDSSAILTETTAVRDRQTDNWDKQTNRQNCNST